MLVVLPPAQSGQENKLKWLRLCKLNRNNIFAEEQEEQRLLQKIERCEG